MTQEQERIEKLLMGKWILEVFERGIKVEGVSITYQYDATHEHYFGNIMRQNRSTGNDILIYELKHTNNQSFIVTSTIEKEICAISPFYMLLKSEDSYEILRRGA